MAKQIRISIIVSGVELSDLEDIEEKLRELLEAYPDNRMTINISDRPSIRTSLGNNR